MRDILIQNARENNLKNISLSIPHYQLIVVTGVSGSGKSSLVYNVVAAEGQRLLYENFGGGRLLNAAPAAPQVDRIEGLFPVIVIDQKQGVRNPRSTVGTLTGIYDMLRLLFARLGRAEPPLEHQHRSLFSFNSPEGWCEACKGLGVQDHIDPALLIGDPSKTIREGAFVLTTPNNYIVYSQVTMEVLDEVCRAEGFSVDIPWKDLSADQKNVVLRGSQKKKVLFGKHPLESRLKWTGITAKPREEDYYKGILTVMEDILKRERNPNIMRFARSQTCTVCNGNRLNDNAMSVKLWGRAIPEFAGMTIKELHGFFKEAGRYDANSSLTEDGVVKPVQEAILKRTGLLLKLGAGHLTLNREAPSLNGGEAQRIRLANHAVGGLRNVLYLLDEPSAGLHPVEQRDLLDVLRSLVNQGNTVMLVDHDEQSIGAADWIVEIGPGAGKDGGEIVYNGRRGDEETGRPGDEETGRRGEVVNKKWWRVEGVERNNLKDFSAEFVLGGLNVVTGMSGSGKTSLLDFILETVRPGSHGGSGFFKKVIHVDASPIGRTPKSNPATYTGLSDHIRDLLAALPESKARKYKKGQFSFVVKGGRCEACGGAGVQQIGMHFLGNVEVKCEACEGKRFTEETLEIRYKGMNIFDILELTIEDAHEFFAGQKKIQVYTSILKDLGLGYMKLGQPSTTLSGGEAQRIKLATELARPASGNTLYILIEPTTGLHSRDVQILMKALRGLSTKGHTLICEENDPQFVAEADWVVEMGAKAEVGDGGSGDVGSGKVEGGKVEKMRLTGVETNNLRGIDVDFELDGITVVTGRSGAGKSSLVFGTLYAESQRRFLEGMPSYVRQFAVKSGVPVLREVSGLVPAIAVRKKNQVKNPRSTIATYTGLYDLYRLMFSRLATSGREETRPLSSAFSFNAEEGACEICRGLGSLTVCDPDRLVTDRSKALIAGALDGSKSGRFYGDPDGQYVHTLLRVGEVYGVDFSLPYNELDDKALNLALRGTGNEVFEVAWRYRRGQREGVHRMSTTWPGFLALVEDEYQRKHHDARGEAMLDLMKSETCETCGGHRLKPRILGYRLGGKHIGEVTKLSADEAYDWFMGYFQGRFLSAIEHQAAQAFREPILSRLEALMEAGLEYITTDRLVGTLSGGEFQRLQLAQLARAPLTGVAYLLDEPSFGLHPVNIKRVRHLIEDLHQRGNTVVMIDHSEELLEMAGRVVRLEQGGLGGGRIRNYEFGIRGGRLGDFETRRLGDFEMGRLGEGLRVRGARANNLRGIDVEVPAGGMTVLTGVSGSGKSSLLDRVIWASQLAGRAVHCDSIDGLDRFSEIIYVEQSLPLTRAQSTVGSMLGIDEQVASLFTQAPSDRKSGFKTKHFIRGAREGRCRVCEGSGGQAISMDFFADVLSPCESCGGTGFSDEVLDIRVDGRNVHEVLNLPFFDLAGYWEPKLPQRHLTTSRYLMRIMAQTGMSHLSAGRSLATLSTGELQRLKLIQALSSIRGERALIMLDEPTGGLSPEDVVDLMGLFSDLLKKGHTLLCVTHDKNLVKMAGKVIELGPGGGRHGGRLIQST